LPEVFDESVGADDESTSYVYCESLVSRAHNDGVATLSPYEHELLVRLGYYYLGAGENASMAFSAFAAAKNFIGIREVADYLLCKCPNHYDLPKALVLLEDHEGVRNLLNRNDFDPRVVIKSSFRHLTQLLCKHIENFLEENKTPIATGTFNEGIDLIAIRNLAQQYDVAVPIARGGLNQGAIANLWGMPTRVIDIAAHERKVPRGKWVNPVSPEDFKGKRVLLLDKDIVTGASIRKTIKMLSRFEVKSMGVYFTYPIPDIGAITSGLPEGLEIYSPDNAPMRESGDAYIEAREKLETLYGRRKQVKDLFSCAN